MYFTNIYIYISYYIYTSHIIYSYIFRTLINKTNQIFYDKKCCLLLALGRYLTCHVIRRQQSNDDSLLVGFVEGLLFENGVGLGGRVRVVVIPSTFLGQSLRRRLHRRSRFLPFRLGFWRSIGRRWHRRQFFTIDKRRLALNVAQNSSSQVRHRQTITIVAISTYHVGFYLQNKNFLSSNATNGEQTLKRDIFFSIKNNAFSF